MNGADSIDHKPRITLTGMDIAMRVAINGERRTPTMRDVNNVGGFVVGLENTYSWFSVLL